MLDKKTISKLKEFINFKQGRGFDQTRKIIRIGKGYYVAVPMAYFYANKLKARGEVKYSIDDKGNLVIIPVRK